MPSLRNFGERYWPSFVYIGGDSVVSLKYLLMDSEESDYSSSSSSDYSSSSSSSSDSESDVPFIPPPDPLLEVRDAINAPMTVIEYTSEDDRILERQRREIAERVEQAAEAYRDRHRVESDDDASTVVLSDSDEEKAVVSLKY